MHRFLRFIGGAVLAAASALPSVAKANGRFPTANQLVVDPADPARIVVRATIGVLVSTDAGDTWSWICESAYSSKVLLDDPAIGITADGSILVGGTNGMARGQKDGCSFAVPTGVLVDQRVIDLAVEPANRAHAYAVYGVPPELPISGRVARSVDNGASWAAVGPAIDDFTPLTIDVAPSNPDVLYASGLDAVAVHQLLFRSDDAGKTWKRNVIPGPGNVYIAAIDPLSADTIYIRTDADQSRLMVSDDGGASEDGGTTFRELLTAGDLLLGFALSPDGKQIAAGSTAEGVFLLTRSAADAGAWTPEKIRKFEVACLTWAAAGLYACSNEQRDGFAIGLSADARQTFSPLLQMPDLAPLVCPGEPLRCAADWCAVAPTIGVDAGCAPEPASRDAGPEGGAFKDGPIGPEGDVGPAPAPVSSRGCGCRLTVGRSQRGSMIGALLCACVVGWRSRRRTPKTPQNGMADRN